MRDYGKVHTSFWTSTNIRALSDDGRLLALYLLTCPHGTISGVFRLPDGYVSDDMKWTVERVREGFAELLSNGFATRCDTTNWVWVTKHLEWNPPENPNQKKAAAKVVGQVPDECGWKQDFMRVCAESLGIDWSPKSNPSETVTEPLLNQEQGQYQKQNTGLSESRETGESVETETVAPLTLVGEICTGLKAMGMGMMNQSNPDFVMLLEAGADAAEFLNTAAEIKAKSPDKFFFNYLVSTVKHRRIDAKNNSSRVFRGPLIAMQSQQPKTASERRRQTAVAMFPSYHNQDRQNANVIDITPANSDRALISQDG